MDRIQLDGATGPIGHRDCYIDTLTHIEGDPLQSFSQLFFMHGFMEHTNVLHVCNVYDNCFYEFAMRIE